MNKTIFLALTCFAFTGCQTTEQRNHKAVGTIMLHAIRAEAAVKACPKQVWIRNREFHSKIIASANKSSFSAELRKHGTITHNALLINDRCDELGEKARSGRLKKIFLEAR